MPSDPFVDVVILAYNHERFISEAVEGVLGQRAAFPVHVIIVEDCSTDGTRATVRALAQAHPDIIDLRLHERNRNDYRSLREALSASRARYVAVLDGDDVWTAPDKLQRQVDFLEGHPDCALCFHPVEIVDAGGQRIGITPSHPKTFSTIAELFVANFPYLCSVLYRRSALADIPTWFDHARTADRNLHLLAARSGPIGYLDEVLAAWRVHPGGVWSPLGRVGQAQWAVETQLELLEHFGEAHHPEIRMGLVDRYLELAAAQAEEGDRQGLAATLDRVRDLAHGAERAQRQAAGEQARLEREAALEGEKAAHPDEPVVPGGRAAADVEPLVSRVARRVKSASPWPSGR